MSSFDISAMLPYTNIPSVYSIPIQKKYINIPRFHAFKGDTTSTLSEIISAKLDRNKTALIVTATISRSVKGAAIFVARKKLSARCTLGNEVHRDLPAQTFIKEEIGCFSLRKLRLGMHENR